MLLVELVVVDDDIELIEVVVDVLEVVVPEEDEELDVLLDVDEKLVDVNVVEDEYDEE
ncbi:MAG: hypothetical protein ACRDHZ_21150 [Ktedonobacteraceae bacterium]